jgi:hypothetical protein
MQKDKTKAAHRGMDPHTPVAVPHACAASRGTAPRPVPRHPLLSWPPAARLDRRALPRAPADPAACQLNAAPRGSPLHGQTASPCFPAWPYRLQSPEITCSSPFNKHPALGWAPRGGADTGRWPRRATGAVSRRILPPTVWARPSSPPHRKLFSHFPRFVHSCLTVLESSGAGSQRAGLNVRQVCTGS